MKLNKNDKAILEEFCNACIPGCYRSGNVYVYYSFVDFLQQTTAVALKNKKITIEEKQIIHDDNEEFLNLKFNSDNEVKFHDLACKTLSILRSIYPIE